MYVSVSNYSRSIHDDDATRPVMNVLQTDLAYLSTAPSVAPPPSQDLPSTVQTPKFYFKLNDDETAQPRPSPRVRDMASRCQQLARVTQ